MKKRFRKTNAYHDLKETSDQYGCLHESYHTQTVTSDFDSMFLWEIQMNFDTGLYNQDFEEDIKLKWK